jgi:lactoylglutathione lyase
MIQFGYTILYVADVEKSIAFYENAFGFERKFITPDNDYGELNTGQTSISFASKALVNSNLKEGFIESKIEDKPLLLSWVL